MDSILISLSLEHCSFHYFCYLHMKRFTYGSVKYEKTITFKILYLYIYLLERSWSRKKFLSASFNDNCLVTRRAVTLKTVLFCTTRIIFSCLTFFRITTLSIHAKKHQPRTFWKLIALFNREVRSDKGCVACPMHSQAISHLCSFCIKEQQQCLWASRGLIMLLCPVSLSHQMYLPHKNCHIKNYTCIRGVMLEARHFYSWIAWKSFNCFIIVALPLIDEQRQNYSKNQKERDHKKTKIWPET